MCKCIQDFKNILSLFTNFSLWLDEQTPHEQILNKDLQKFPSKHNKTRSHNCFLKLVLNIITSTTILSVTTYHLLKIYFDSVLIVSDLILALIFVKAERINQLTQDI